MAEPISEAVVATPHPALAPYVDGYLGYRMTGFGPGLHRGLPGRYLTCIISLDDPVDIVAMPDPRQRPGRYGAFVSGLWDAPAGIAHAGTQHGISVDLTPLGARALLGLPAAELAGLVVDLDDVLGTRLPGSTAGGLQDRLASTPGWGRRLAVLDRALLDALGRSRPVAPRPEVVATWERVVGSGGSQPIGELATELGWSRRHLGERFRAEIGLPPKALARIVRFERAKNLLRRPDRPGLATVAATTGYYDQAHLTREWHALAGCTPTTWLAEELPPVQDPTPVGGAG